MLGMAMVITLAETHIPDETAAVLRRLLVCSCGLALIFAGQPMPI